MENPTKSIRYLGLQVLQELAAENNPFAQEALTNLKTE